MGSIATGGQLGAIVLAAGEGTRMRSSTPKPLHELCGRAMVLHILDALAMIDVDRVVVVVGHQAERVRAAISDGAPQGLDVQFVTQEQQRGTGDAVSIALSAFDHFREGDDLLVMPADTPLLTSTTLANLVRRHRAVDTAVTLLSTTLEDPTGYGRILRARDGRVCGIVEQADATEQEQLIREINTSIYCFRAALVGPALRRISASNAQGELYLTDIVGVLFEAGYQSDALAGDQDEVAGVNDRLQLAAAEAVMRRRINESWMRRGINLEDPDGTMIDWSVVLHADTQILAGTSLRGHCEVGGGCRIGPHAVIEDAHIGENVTIRSAEIRGATVGNAATIESFCQLGPGAWVADAEVLEAFTKRP